MAQKKLYNCNTFRCDDENGFTFIEIIFAIALIAVLFVPVMQLFSDSVYAVAVNQEKITAVNLAAWQMERIKNLDLTKKELEKKGGFIYPGKEEEPLKMNKVDWRIQTEIVKGTDPLEVHVTVYRDGHMGQPLIKLVTLFEDMIWEEVKAL